MRVEVREFPAVEVAPPRPEKASQSFLNKLDACPRSAYFYLRYGGGAGSAAMATGSAFHSFAERATKLAAETGEQMPPDVGRDLMSVVLAEHKELVVPEAHHDELRAMAWNWCEATHIDSEAIVACEEMWEARVGDWIVRGKVDLAQWDVQGLLRVSDYKTSRYLPSQDDVARQFQGRFYCFLMAQGWPEGLDERILPPVARVMFEQVYPRYTDSESGALVARSFEMDANEIADFRRSLELLLERADYGLETGMWPAQAGSHCSQCPAPKECPIPAHLNASLPLSSEHEAQTAAQLSMDHEKRKKALDAALKAWVNENGEVEVGDLTFGFAPQESRTLDKDALDAALTSHEPVDPDDLYRVRHSTRFGKRKSTNGGSNE